MELEYCNKRELTLSPDLEEHVIKFYSNVASSRFTNVEFKGFLEFDYNEDLKYTYYGITSLNEDKIYLAIKTFEYEDIIDHEEYELNQFIRNKARDYNRNGNNNVSYDKNDIKELLLPNINIDNIKEYCSEYKYLIFFSGCDDGSTFLRFNSEEKRDKFLDTLTEFESFEDLFFHEQEDFILYYFN